MRDIVKAFRRPHRFARCRFARATGTAASQGFRTASRTACDAPHRRAMRSWPKTLGNRLYGSLSALLGISTARRRRLQTLARRGVGAISCSCPGTSPAIARNRRASPEPARRRGRQRRRLPPHPLPGPRRPANPLASPLASPRRSAARAAPSRPATATGNATASASISKRECS